MEKEMAFHTFVINQFVTNENNLCHTKIIISKTNISWPWPNLYLDGNMVLNNYDVSKIYKYLVS